jgi:hypothetical protein
MELLKVPDDVLKDLKPGTLRVDKKTRSRSKSSSSTHP